MGLWPVKVYKLLEIAFFVYCEPSAWPVFTFSRGVTGEYVHFLAKSKLLNSRTCITHNNTSDKSSKNIIEYFAEGLKMSSCQTLYGVSEWNHRATAVVWRVGTSVILLTFRAVMSGLSRNFNLQIFIIFTFVWTIDTFSFWRVVTIVNNTRNFWVSGLYPSSGVWRNTTFRKLDLFPKRRVSSNTGQGIKSRNPEIPIDTFVRQVCCLNYFWCIHF
jgi:hypothetical protein